MTEGTPDEPKSRLPLSPRLLNGLLVAAGIGGIAFGALAPGLVIAACFLGLVALVVSRLPTQARRNWYLKMSVVGLIILLVAIDRALA